MINFNKPGRRSKPSGRVPDVETVICPATLDGMPRNHKIDYAGRHRWECTTCHVTWADLDAQIRTGDFTQLKDSST